MGSFINTFFAHGAVALVFGIGGYMTSKIKYAWNFYFNYHKLWAALGGQGTAIILGTKTSDDKKIKIQTHINEAKAYRALHEIISKKATNLKTFASEETWPSEDYKTVILIGGNFRNSTAEIPLRLNKIKFSHIDKGNPINGVKMSIFDKNFKPIYYPLDPTGKPRRIDYDCGVIIRTKINDQSYLILSGCHAYATFAAARVVTEKHYLKLINKDFKKFLSKDPASKGTIIIPIGCSISYSQDSDVGTVQHIEFKEM